MAASLYEYVSIRRHPPGRMMFATKHVLKKADPEREPGLRELAQEGLAHHERTLQLEREWERVKANRSRSRGEAAKWDPELDKGLSAFNKVVEGHMVGDPKDPEVHAATKLQSELFPLGVKAVTHLSFEEELAKTDSIVVDLETKYAPEVRLLGLGRHVTNIKTLADKLREELALNPGALTWDQVQASQRTGQELYAAMILHILGRYASLDPAAAKRREELLSEVNRQDALLLELYRRNRGELDVHPDTGEIVEVTPEPAPAEEPAA